MSTMASADKRILLPGVAGAVLLLLALGWLAFRSQDPPHGDTDVARRSTLTPARGRAIDQANWKITVERAGESGRLPKNAQARMAAQRPRVAAVVRSAYDALFLGAGNPGQYFSRAAGVAFERAEAGPPPGAIRFKITRRVARIALQAASARRAAATVTIAAKGRHDSESFRLEHRARLWLESGEKGWRIIAFDVDQKRIGTRK